MRNKTYFLAPKANLPGADNPWTLYKLRSDGISRESLGVKTEERANWFVARPSMLQTMMSLGILLCNRIAGKAV